MHILAEIDRREGVHRNGRAVERTAVRAVILRGRKLLMVLSTSAGDYKFPGGGVNAGETHGQALRREVEEECGTRLVEMKQKIGAIIEYNFPQEPDFEVFKMTSHYYLCDVEDGFGAQRLESHERDLGFKPVWVDVERALEVNQSILRSHNAPEWLRRELFALEYIRRHLTPGT